MRAAEGFVPRTFLQQWPLSPKTWRIYTNIEALVASIGENIDYKK